jgi:hypothetical protein
MNLRDSIGILLAGALLLVVCLAGVAWIVLQRDIFTVDGLFMALILLTIAGAISVELLLELRRKDSAEASATASTRAGSAAAAAPPAGTVTESGLVEKVEFYEAPVGQPNKTVVALRDRAGKSPRWITFEGNVQHLLPAGRRVRIVYRPEGGMNILVAAE